MRRSFIVAVLFTAFVQSGAFAQTVAATQTAEVNLTVQPAMTLTNVTPLDFGTQVRGATDVSVDPVSGGNNAAYFTLTGAPTSQSLQVSWTASASLSFNGTNISWTPSVAVNDTSVQPQAATITSGSTKRASTSGALWIWVGGTIASIPIGAPAGVYSGDITLTVQY